MAPNISDYCTSVTVVLLTMLNSMKNDNRATERVRIIMEDGCNVSVDKKYVKNLPEWFDEELFTRGQKYFYDNFYSMFMSQFIGLIVVLSIPTILDVLILTKKSSDPYNAFRRYINTTKHMLNWYKYDVKNMRSKSQKSVTFVHGLHCAASRTSEKAGLGLRVSQRDMALTQFGFVGITLIRKKELAIIGTDEDDMAIAHFWRTIGYMLGIQDQYNLCHGTLDEVRSVCAIILRDVYAPALKDPPKDYHRMVEAVIEGLKPVVPILDLDAVMTYVYELLGVCVWGQRLATRYSRWMYNVQIYIHQVLLTKRWLAFVFRPLLNYIVMFSVWMNITLPFGAALKFGTKVFSREVYNAGV